MLPNDRSHIIYLRGKCLVQVRQSTSPLLLLLWKRKKKRDGQQGLPLTHFLHERTSRPAAATSCAYVSRLQAWVSEHLLAQCSTRTRSMPWSTGFAWRTRSYSLKSTEALPNTMLNHSYRHPSFRPAATQTIGNQDPQLVVWHTLLHPLISSFLPPS